LATRKVASAPAAMARGGWRSRRRRTGRSGLAGVAWRRHGGAPRRTSASESTNGGARGLGRLKASPVGSCSGHVEEVVSDDGTHRGGGAVQKAAGRTGEVSGEAVGRGARQALCWRARLATRGAARSANKGRRRPTLQMTSGPTRKYFQILNNHKETR
jgi:hypothetical protein